MKILLFLLAFLLPASLWANAGIFDGGGHSVVMTSSAKIQMVSEEVTMALKRAISGHDRGREP